MGFKKTQLTKDYEDQLRLLGEIDVSGKKMTASKVNSVTDVSLYKRMARLQANLYLKVGYRTDAHFCHLHE